MNQPQHSLLPIITQRPISKSTVRAMGCERHYAEYHLGNPILRQVASPLAQTGTDFHVYRQEYVAHLIDVGQEQDGPWVEAWLSKRAVSDEARAMIERDLRFFRVDPEAVFGSEVFLSINRDMEPLERLSGLAPGTTSERPDAYVTGMLDLLILSGALASIVDYKTGWNASGVQDHEAAINALLVFAHFQQVEEVYFTWEFVRAGAGKPPVRYTRDDMDWLRRMAHSAHARREDIERRRTRGEPLSVNPFAGLCQFCQLTCPLREAVTRGLVEIPPIQTDDDARLIAQRVAVAEAYVRGGRALLRPFLDQRGALDLGGGYEATMAVRTEQKFPLDAVLRVLGQQEWGIPLSSLTVSASKLKGYAKAKKRAGLSELLDAIAIKWPKSILRLGKANDELEEGDV